ncbi:MAG: hypothetical protein Q9210_005269 [Variospora velana]
MAGYYPLPPRARPPPRRRGVTIDFITCSLNYRPNLRSTPRILDLRCDSLPYPCRGMLLRYSGMDRELSEWFFAHREYRVTHNRALDEIDDALEKWQPNRHGPRLVAIVRCKAGVHRSVAMAERLAREVRRWDGVRITMSSIKISMTG